MKSQNSNIILIWRKLGKRRKKGLKERGNGVSKNIESIMSNL